MAGEAPQLSFIQGEISPEFHYRSDLANFNSSLSKAVNVQLHPLGGVSNRVGSNTVRRRTDIKDFNFSTDYVACQFQHYISRTTHLLEVIVDEGRVKIFIDGVRHDNKVYEYGGVQSALNIRGDIKGGLQGLRFVLSNDTVIFSKSLPVAIDKSTLASGYHKYLESAQSIYAPVENNRKWDYTETQFSIRMSPYSVYEGGPSGGLTLESNFTLRNAAKFEAAFASSMQSTRTTSIVGCATYAVIGETEDGVDSLIMLPNAIPGLNMPVSGSATVNDVIPYPVNNSTTNVINITNVSDEVRAYGWNNLSKIKIYRASGKNVSFNGLYKLVAKFGVEGAVSLSTTDTGQEEAAYTVCSDTSMMYRQPSLVSISSDAVLHRVLGGVKSVVDTAIFQQRAYYAINKRGWWGTSVFDNTIVVSRIGAPSQVLQPQISNPAEAFQFEIPEEKSGSLTHLAALSRLVAFTDKSTYIVQGDEAGIITPTAINPYKVLSFGCKPEVAPVVSGETCLFAATCGGIGYVSITSGGDTVAGLASALAGHLFKNKRVLSIIPLPDRLGLPRFLINTFEGDVYEVYRVGETFSFFPYKIKGVFNSIDNSMLPSTVNLSGQTQSALGAEAYVNVKIKNSDGNNDVYSIVVRSEVEKSFFTDNLFSALDHAYSVGPEPVYYTGPQADTGWGNAYPMNMPGWRKRDYIYNLYDYYDLVAPLLLVDGSVSIGARLSLDTGTGLANSDGIEMQFEPLPEVYNTGADIYAELMWKEEGEVVTQLCKIERNPDASPYYRYYFVFEEEPKDKIKDSNTKLKMFYGYTENSDPSIDLDKGLVLVSLAFSKLKGKYDPLTSGTDYGSTSDMFHRLRAYCTLMGFPLGEGTEAEPKVYPITGYINGRVYGNFYDPLDTTEMFVKHYVIPPDPVLELPEYWVFELEFPEVVTGFTVGCPAIAEIETLPVANIQSDITDAQKNINYGSLILYKTKGVRIGESGQPDDQLERLDFTTEDSVDKPVEFSGPMSSNFASSWNGHGKVRVSGLDLQPFTISGIIPKGNVGGF